MKQRPLSPFMLGPYYRPQLTSMLSITHRATGVLLSLAGAPLLLWWLVALGDGAASYRAMTGALARPAALIVLVPLLFSLCFHFFNGIRHLIWDTGRMLDLPGVYRSGWAVLALSIAATAVSLGALL